MAQLSSKTIVSGDTVFTEFKGALAEQYVFQQLMLNENLAINYFTFDSSKYEIDFLIQTLDDGIIPVEVKSSFAMESWFLCQNGPDLISHS